ncbi:MAG: 4Fe-4S dicluster domain-containing protein [Desulfarculaceae bacterium]
MTSDTTIKPYQMLARHLDDAPLGAPLVPELLDLLQELFGPQEAEVCSCLPFKPNRLDRLALEMGRDPVELGDLLARLARRGLVYERETPKGSYYSLLPVVPGMSETQFMAGEVGEDKKKLAALFDAYYRPGIGTAMVEASTPYSRVIPVGRSLEPSQEILPYEKAEGIIKQQTSLALANCYCRHEADLLGKGCGKPKNVCLIFGGFAEYAVNKGFAKPLEVEKALEALLRAEEAGLVHVTDNAATGVNFMCNCCGCCCLFLKTITDLKRPGAVAQAAFVAEVDIANCSGCGLCLAVCQVNAIRLDDSQTAQAEADKCLGCGQCAFVCPEDAISMQRRKTSNPPAATWPELAARLHQKKIQQDSSLA